MTDAIKLAIEALEMDIFRTEAAEFEAKKSRAIKALAALRAQPDIVGTKTWFKDGVYFTQNLTRDEVYKDTSETEIPVSTQPDHIVDANGMVDHSELEKDAARYRWMKKEVVRIPPGWALVGWDVAIDHAMEMENK